MISSARIVWTSIRLAAVVALGMPAAAAGQKPAASNVAASFEAVNVCEKISGESLAGAVSGKLLDTRPVNIKGFAAARCIYGVEIGNARRTFVLWLNPANDYDGLRKAAGAAIKPIEGIGDAAHVQMDEETKRYSLTAMKRGKVTIQITGEQTDWVQAIAKLALSQF